LPAPQSATTNSEKALRDSSIALTLTSLGPTGPPSQRAGWFAVRILNSDKVYFYSSAGDHFSMRSRLSYLLVIPMMALAACGATAAAVVPSPGAATVKVTKADPQGGCSEVGPIEGIHGSGCGSFGRAGTYEGAYATLKNEAVAKGANYVRIDQQIQPHSEAGCFDQRFVIRGVAFACK
jgi:hypothetical protein